MGDRAERRTSLTLQVRIGGKDRQERAFTRLADVVDVSKSGARFAGLYVDLQPGTVLTVQCGNSQATFRIAWVGEKSTARFGEIGVTALEPNVKLWEVNAVDLWKDMYAPATPTVNERRAQARYKSDFTIRVTAQGATVGSFAKCADISTSGCYIESWTPFDIGTVLCLHFHGDSYAFVVKAVVRSKDPGFGMGVYFNEVDSPDVLGRVVAKCATDALLDSAEKARHDHAFAKAEKDAREAVDVCRQHSAVQDLARALAALGRIEREQHRADDALQHYLEAAALYRKERNAATLAQTLQHAADIYREARRLAEAEPFYDEAMSIYRGLNDTPLLDLANALRGMALLKSDLVSMDEARVLWEEARYLYSSVGADSGVAESAQHLAQLAAPGYALRTAAQAGKTN